MPPSTSTHFLHAADLKSLSEQKQPQPDTDPSFLPSPLQSRGQHWALALPQQTASITGKRHLYFKYKGLKNSSTNITGPAAQAAGQVAVVSLSPCASCQSLPKSPLSSTVASSGQIPGEQQQYQSTAAPQNSASAPRGRPRAVSLLPGNPQLRWQGITGASLQPAQG